MTDKREYTFRYLNAEGRFVAIVHADCTGTRDAVCKAAQYLSDNYEALEISEGDDVRWAGLREDALKLARPD